MKNPLAYLECLPEAGGCVRETSVEAAAIVARIEALQTQIEILVARAESKVRAGWSAEEIARAKADAK
jgi:hypothetical protein